MALTAALRDLNKLNAFVRVAERRSFTRAAADLRTTPSLLSRHMKELEEALGFTLLNRSTHGLVLTDAGEGLFQDCLRLLATLDDFVVATRNLQKGPYGTLRVLAAGDFARHVLTPRLGEFAHRCPGLHIQLTTTAAGATAAEAGFDVVIAARKPALPGLIDIDLGTVRHVVCAAPAYFRARGRPKKPQDLLEHACLVDTTTAPNGWPFRLGARRLVVAVKGPMSANSAGDLAQWALQGHGIVRVPRYVVKKQLAERSLQAIFGNLAFSPERMRAYYSKAKHLPAKTAEFIHFLERVATNA